MIDPEEICDWWKLLGDPYLGVEYDSSSTDHVFAYHADWNVMLEALTRETLTEEDLENAQALWEMRQREGREGEEYEGDWVIYIAYEKASPGLLKLWEDTEWLVLVDWHRDDDADTPR